MTAPTWAILVPTIPQRERLFGRLVDRLLPQLDIHRGAVRVLAWRNAGERTIGEIRDAMLHAAGTDYVSFVDDDDLVPDDYVHEVVTALATRPDHVGYLLEYTTNGTGRELVDHSLVHGRWHRNASGQLVRDFTHVDPIRRDIATRGRFAAARAGRAEDRAWCKQVRPFLASGTEAYIPRVMYHYQWDAAVSAWQRPELIAPAITPLPTIRSEHFAWHPESR